MKDEDWHFTSVAPIADRVFHPAKPGTISRATLEKLGLAKLQGLTLVFVNGVFSPDLSLPRVSRIGLGLSLESLATAIRRGDESDLQNEIGSAATNTSSAFTALNSAFFSDGALIRIADGASLDGTIDLVFVSTDNADSVSHVRNLIVAGRNCRATIVESYVSTGEAAYFTNAVTEVLLSEGARVNHYKLQSEGMSAFHVGTTQARQLRSSYYESFSFATGGDLSRTNVYTVLEGDGAECVLNGLYLADGTQHMDHQTFVEHIAPNCPSHELYKGILDGSLARRFQRQGLRPSRGAEDRRQAEQQQSSPLRSRARRHKAAAGNLRRRRKVYARCDRRQTRRDRVVLLAESWTRQICRAETSHLCVCRGCSRATVAQASQGGARGASAGAVYRVTR